MRRPKSSSSTSPESAERRPSLISYLAVYRASPLERITMIRGGVRAAEAKRMIADLAIGQGTALKALKLSPATVNKKAKQNETLSPGESERLIGIARLVGQLQAMVEESGDPKDFDAAAWIARWLSEPSAARTPSICWTPWRGRLWCRPLA